MFFFHFLFAPVIIISLSVLTGTIQLGNLFTYHLTYFFIVKKILLLILIVQSSKVFIYVRNFIQAMFFTYSFPYKV